MLSGPFKTLLIAAIIALALPVHAGDPFLERAVREMEGKPAPKREQPTTDEKPEPDDRPGEGRGSDPARDAADRRAAAREKLRQQREGRATQKALDARANLGPALADARRLIDRKEYHAAYKLLIKARKSVEPLHDPAVQAMLGQLALIDHKPDKALDLLAPVLPAPDPAIGRLDPRTLTEEQLAPLIGPLMVAGQAHNALAIHQSRAAAARADAVDDDAWPPRDTPDRRARENTFFGIPIEAGENPEPTSTDELVAMLGLANHLPDLDFLGVPIDAATDKPALTPEARLHADQALRVFDHLAGHAEGNTRVEAAWRCGRALALLGRYDEAVGAFKFAADSLRFEHSAELPAHLKPLADAIARDRKRVEYLRDVLRYGLEYMLFRRAQQHRRAGRYEQAAIGYRRCIAGAQQTMGRLLIDQLSTDLNTLSPDALKQKKPGALPGESPYTAAARLYEALCLIELGDAKRAVELLHAFVAEDPATVLPTPAQQAELDRTLLEDRVPVAPPLLYRGEALRELGRLALEHELDLDRAEAYFARLDHWLRQARVDSSGWDYASKLPGIKAAAKVRTDGPRAEYQKPDFWGNVRASKLDPGMLVNRRTTPWYLDDLEEDCAKFRGFVHFARGDGEKALAQWRRIIALDTEAKDGDLATSPNNFTRLKFGAEHGYLIAYPQELALYPGRLRTAVMLGDFYYVTQQHHRATMTCERLLEGAYETLSPAQHDYVHFLLGSVIYRHRSTGKRRHTTIDAINCWMKILEHRDDTWTEPRSAVTISNVSRMVGDPEIQDAGRALLLAAAKSNQDHPSVHEARIILAFDLMWERRDGEARRWLDRVPESAGKKYERAQNIVMQLDDPESNLWKFLQRNEP